MKKVMLSAAALMCGTLMFAQTNTSTVDQNGTTHTSTVDQIGNGNSSSVTQND